MSAHLPGLPGPLGPGPAPDLRTASRAAFRAATVVPRLLVLVALTAMLAAGGVDIAVVQVGTAPLDCQSSASFPPWATATVVLLPLAPVALALVSLVGHLRARRRLEIAWGRRLEVRGIAAPVATLVVTASAAVATWFFALLAVGVARWCF